MQDAPECWGALRRMAGVVGASCLADDRTLDLVCASIVDLLETGQVEQLVSYYHPNGFSKVVLGAIVPEARELFVVHHWHADSVVGDVHNHRWEFSSRVLIGELTVRTYGISDLDGGPCQAFRCWGPTPNSYAFDGLDLVELTELGHEVVPAGSIYSLAMETFHDATVDSGLETVTIVAQTAPQRDESRVIRARLAPPRPTLENVGLPIDQVESTLKTVLTALGG